MMFKAYADCGLLYFMYRISSYVGQTGRASKKKNLEYIRHINYSIILTLMLLLVLLCE